MSTSLKPTTAPGDLLPGRWFDGRSSKARPVLVGLQPTPQGPSLVLHPLSPPGAAPVVFTSRQVDWPEAWNERRPPPCVVLDLRDHGSVEIDAVAPWRAALAAAGNRPGIAQHMQTRSRQVETVIRRAARVLSDATKYTSVVVAPHIGSLRIRHVQIVPVSSGTAMLIIVTHAATDAALSATVNELAELDTVNEVTSVMRVEGD